MVARQWERKIEKDVILNVYENVVRVVHERT